MQDAAERRDRSLFSSASADFRAAIERAAVPVSLADGAMLFEQGETADSFFILDEGEIEISVLSPGGRKLALEIMMPGEILGEIGLFAGRRTASATALGAAKLRRVRRSDLMVALRHEPDLALQMIDLLCARLREVSDKLEDRAFLPLPIRLAKRLLRLEDKLGRSGEAIPVSQSDLADFVGATREAVTKTLSVWRSEEWVALARGSVRILDRTALEELVESGDD